MKPHCFRCGEAPGFTLIELLVVIAIIGVLASMLSPALGRAKQKTQLTKCLSNLHQIAFGMHMYLGDSNSTFPPGDSTQFNSSATPYVNYGNALGGGDPEPELVPLYSRAKDRLLAPYISGSEAWHCPADRGMDVFKVSPSCFKVFGGSYRFNWYLQDNYQKLGVAEDPGYNLAGKKEDWVLEPTRFIMFHEAATFPWDVDGAGTVSIAQWHYSKAPGKAFNPANLKLDRDKLVAPILFVDGHSHACDFTKIFHANPLRALEPGEDWMWYKPAK